MNIRLSFSAYLPAQIAAMVDEIGVKKATMPILQKECGMAEQNFAARP